MKLTFIPRRYKYKKLQKQKYRLNGVLNCNFMLVSHNYYIKVMKKTFLNPRQLEAYRRILRKDLKRIGFVRSYIVCDLSRTVKASGVRMGKGKGKNDHWVSPVLSGRVLFSIHSVGVRSAFFVLSKGRSRFPVNTRIFIGMLTNNRFNKKFLF